MLLPKSVWASRHKSRIPVLVYIHGGGFDVHWKDASGRGYGLVKRSQQGGGPGMIFVTINYRLGLFVSLVPVFQISKEDYIALPVSMTKLTT